MPERSPPSLRARLLKVLMLPLLGLLLISVIADYRTALQLANERYDHTLMGMATALASRLERDDDDKSIEVDLPPAADAIVRADPQDPMRYLVQGADGSRIAGDAALSQLAQPAQTQPRIWSAQLDGEPVRVAQYPYSDAKLSARVVVVQTMQRRDITASRIVRAVIWPNVLLICAVLLVVHGAVRYALRPLDTLGNQIAARRPNDGGPIAESGIPRETRPLVQAINRLLDSQQRAANAQQNFLSDAAHQLRTPLTALQTQLELAERALPASEQGRIQNLLQACGRIIHSTNQMLSLARSAGEAGAIANHETFDASGLLEDCASDYLDLALSQGIDLGFEHQPTTLHGSRWLIQEALANLVSNAIRYTLRGGRVTVRCTGDEAGGTLLAVEDTGPGIPPDERDKVCERFYRGRQQLQHGSGLGLAIVRQVAELHGAALRIDDGPGGQGTCISLYFPPRPTPSPLA